MESNTYPTEDLINRLYDELKNNEQKFTLKLDLPKVSCMNKRTNFSNFRDLCKKIKRSENEVKEYFDNELRNPSSIDSNGVLVITGTFKEQGIRNVFEKYIRAYVTCKECGSLNTDIIKENRINFVNCNRCYSKKPIKNN